ncbi:putative mitochondrial protein [Tanacetum coccineum]
MFKNSTTRKTLIPVEFDDKRSKGVCFFYDENYVFGHRCPGKKPQLYHLQLEDECIEDNEEGEMEETENLVELEKISVHALSRVNTYKTIIVTGHVGRKKLQKLFDTGSTHNFMDTSVALKLGLRLVKRTPLQLKVADGNKLISDTMVTNFQWKMNGLIYTTDVFLIPLGGCDVVLGIQWFTGLKGVYFDFINRSIEFLKDGRKVTLRGSSQKFIKTVCEQQLTKGLPQDEEASMI